ncbi:hypothetical protein DNL40_02480 [Xylanimonas oleitrophica]|uniref:Uncharacterized protein n=1 Tax=Xylanimonas oleitrophica TaxID=2607479 RepID=A0A2W5WVD5_9MICO|nr:hypothetical protein [Xylanimonas oleitrophica]PZR55257.1 hypothetical protein DNL40_02480 [Xylanimonas oleitrophica]
MSADVMQRLAEMQARADAATDGPWHRDRTALGACYLISVRAPGLTVADGLRKPDAEFIAHARADVPALLAFAREVLALADDKQRHRFEPGYVDRDDIHALAATYLGGEA